MSRRAPERKVDRDALCFLVERGGVPFRQNPRSWFMTCPRCGKKVLYIEKATGRCRCMKCGPGFQGWADYVLSVVYHRSREELSEVLFGGVLPGVGFDDAELDDLVDPWDEWGKVDEVELVVQAVTPPPPPIVWSPDVVDLDHPAAARGVAYLESRGITLALATKYGIRYNPREKRVCFPVVVDGELRGWQGRYIGPTVSFTEEGLLVTTPKILTVGAIGGRALMCQDRLKSAKAAILVEGPFDNVKCDLVHETTCGGVANTATMGKSFTQQQVEIYLRSGIERLYVGLDDDADERIMQVAQTLAHRLELFRLATPPGREDLGAATPEEVYAEFRRAKPLRPTDLYVDVRLNDPRWSC